MLQVWLKVFKAVFLERRCGGLMRSWLLSKFESQRSWLPPREQLLLSLILTFREEWTCVPVNRLSVLSTISCRFTKAIGWELTWQLYTTQPEHPFGKCKAFKQAFANKQWLDVPSGFVLGIASTTLWLFQVAIHCNFKTSQSNSV